MKLKTTLIALAAVLLATASLQAQSNDDERFFANEFTFDAFASYNKADQHFEDIFDESWRHGHWGGGVGLNYFILRNLGVGVDTYFNDQGSFFKNIAGSVIFRVPFGNCGLAPYAFGGIGGRFDPVDELTGHVGIGLEVRLNPRIGLFSDIRYTWADKTSDEALVRAGLRFGLNKK